MRSYLLKSMVAVFAALAMLAFAAGGAMAQDEGPKISGGAGVGFGLLSYDSGATAEPGINPAPVDGDTFNAQIESNLIVSGKHENMDYYFRMRARGTKGDPGVAEENGITGEITNVSETEGTFGDGQLQTVRVRVGWNAGPLRIEAGKLPGIGGTGLADLQAVRAPNNFRHFVNNLAMFDSGAISIAYNAGPVRAGLAISADCQVGCTGGFADGESEREILDANGDVATSRVRYAIIGNQNTLLPFVQASFGPAKVGFRYAQSTSKVWAIEETTTDVGLPAEATTDKLYDADGEGSGMVLEGSVAAGPVGIALEYTATTANCINAVGASGCKDTESTDIGLAVTWTGLALLYSTHVVDSTTTGVSDDETTVISAHYLIDVGGGKIGPEVASFSRDRAKGAGVTATDRGGADPSGTLIRLLMTIAF